MSKDTPIEIPKMLCCRSGTCAVKSWSSPAHTYWAAQQARVCSGVWERLATLFRLQLTRLFLDLLIVSQLSRQGRVHAGNKLPGLTCEDNVFRSTFGPFLQVLHNVTVLTVGIESWTTMWSISLKDFFLPELSVNLLWVSLVFQPAWHLSSWEIKKKTRPKVVILWNMAHHPYTLVR